MQILISLLILYHLKPSYITSSKLVSICWGLFNVYSAPEKFSSNGSLPFTFSLFQQFLKTWCVKYRPISVTYPINNGKAEFAVKTAKKIVNGNTDPQSSLDNNEAARTILLYHNTPIQSIGQSPTKLLLHRQLCKFLPSRHIFYQLHPEWAIAAQCHEASLHQCNSWMMKKYNKYNHNIHPLQKGDRVAIQNQLNCWWNITVIPEHK